MSVTDGQKTVAEFKLVGVSAVQGIGFSRLQFSLEVDGTVRAKMQLVQSS
jgi:hypothetical protein